jgi:hypothetical protein
MHTESKQQYGPGSNYGYVCGGYSGDGNIATWYSTIDRFQFPFDSGTVNYVGNLSGSRHALSANNSSTYGYVCGGYNDSNDLSTIDRFQFPFDSGTANHVGNLSGSRDFLCANNSSTYGYVCGGRNNSGYFSTIDRFQFPFNDSTANYVGNLSGSRRALSANNSSTYGYVCGGYSSSYLPTIYSIDRFQFSFDSGTANQVGKLSGSRGWLSANNSSTYGYVCGGWNSSGNGSYLSTIDRFQFPFDSGTANQVGNLSGTRCDLSANNSSTYGYVCGGYNGSNDLSTIDRFQFPFDSGTANQVGNLSGSRDALSATDGVDFVTMFV